VERIKGSSIALGRHGPRGWHCMFDSLTGLCPFHHEPQLKLELQKVSTRDSTSHKLMQLSCADVIVKMIGVASDILYSQRMLESALRWAVPR
jgi:hypothetical protein